MQKCGKYCGGEKILSPPWFQHCGGERRSRPRRSDASGRGELSDTAIRPSAYTAHGAAVQVIGTLAACSLA